MSLLRVWRARRGSPRCPSATLASSFCHALLASRLLVKVPADCLRPRRSRYLAMYLGLPSWAVRVSTHPMAPPQRDRLVGRMWANMSSHPGIPLECLAPKLASEVEFNTEE